MGDPLEGAEARRRKVYMLAKQLRLSREDRLQLAEVLLWRDVPSWSALTDDEIARLLDAFEGYALIAHLLAERNL